MTCPECSQELEIGAWPFCPHGLIHEGSARRFDPIVVWQSNSDPEKFSFPGQSHEACPPEYHRVEITDLRQADRFVSRMNDIERRKLEGLRDMRHALDDAGIKERRRNEDARGALNSRAEALRRRVREWADKNREKRRVRHARLDANFHINVLSFDSGNRTSYSGPETGWRERKD